MTRLAAALLAAAAVSVGCRAPGGCAPRPRAAERQPAPDFSAPDLSGRKVALSELRGKAVLLDFWATWCGPCEETIPYFETLYAKHKARGLEVLGVSVDDYPKDVGPFVKAHRVSYRVVLDPEKTVMEKYGVRSIPSFFLVDREGKVIRKWLGLDAQATSEIEKEVEEALRPQ